LREGTAVSDSLYFDRVVVGGDNPDAVEAVTQLYKDVEAVRDTIADLAGIENWTKPDNT
jgi:UDP-glucose 6-dehydrogenase